MLKVRTQSSRDWHSLRATLDAGESFTSSTGSFHGHSGSTRQPGELYGIAREVYCEHLAAGIITYVIMSYATPIAWQVIYSDGDRAWYVPETKHSVTTSKHQTLARLATSHSATRAVEF